MSVGEMFMPDSPEEGRLPEAERAPDSAQSYGAHLNRRAWELDVGDISKDSRDVPEDEPTSRPSSMVQILEALMFVGGGPLTLERAGAAVRGLTAAQFTEAIDTLNRLYRSQGRPYAIQVQERGYVVTLRPRFRLVVDRLYGQAKEARLSPAAIDVLSLVAYRQPVSKQEVDSIRGYESGALLRQLVRRGLVAIAQRAEAGRREVTYGTTPRFLEMFDLTSLDDLPQTQELQKL
jgi:segregation and condensation protein B